MHTVASGQGVPFNTAVLVQPKTGSQVSVVQMLPSSQSSAEPAVQAPAEQRENLEARCARMGKVAERLYERWAWGLRLA